MLLHHYIVTADLKLVDAKEVGLYKVFHSLVNEAAHGAESKQDEYISVNELCTRLNCAPQTVYNKKRSGVWTEGVHYIKPSGGKLLFKWAAIKEWAESQQSVSAKRNPSPVKLSADKNHSTPHTPTPPSTCAPNKDFVNI